MPTYPQTYPVTAPIAVSISARAGRVSLTAADVAEVTVDLQPRRHKNSAALDVIGETLVDFDGDALRIEVPQKGMSWSSLRLNEPAIDVAVTVPRESTARIKTGSADVWAGDGLGDVAIETGSGDVAVDGCADTSVRTGSGDIHFQNVTATKAHAGSGDIHIESCAGSMTVTTGSGDVEISHVLAHSEFQTASGDIEIGTIEASARLKTASGDVEIRRAVEGEIEARTASGDVNVGIAPGTAAKLNCSSVTGDVESKLEPTDAPAAVDRTVVITAGAISGSVTITRSR